MQKNSNNYNSPTSVTQVSSYIPLAIHIVPSARTQKDQVAALETTLQSFVLSKQHPIALELTGSADQRRFIIRSTTRIALDHVETLLRVQYPQIEIRQLHEHEDPFRLDADEEVSAVELIRRIALSPPTQAGIDPTLGVLSMFDKLPPQTRAIAQIGLRPASMFLFPDRLHHTTKKAAKSATTQSNKETKQPLLDIGPLLFGNIVLILIIYLLARPFLPHWIGDMLLYMVQKRALPHLLAAQIQQLIWYLAGLITINVSLIAGFSLVRRLLSQTSQAQIRYRVRFRLYIIGPKTMQGTLIQPRSIWRFLTNPQQTQTRHDLLLRMAAVYRQPQKDTGIFFIPRSISSNTTHLLLSREIGKLGHGWSRGLSLSQQPMDVEEAALLWHLPPANVLSEMAFVEYRRSRMLLMPSEIARQSQGLTPVGFSENNGHHIPFALPPQFFSYHTLIGGKSSSGKIALMKHIAREAMALGGLCLVDPYGDLCEQVLQIVPADRVEDVILIDLADNTASVGLNPLDVTLGRERDKAISDILKMLAHIWASSWGSRMENAFEMCLRTLFEANKMLVASDPLHGPQQQFTLLDVLPLLTNANFCHALLQQIQDDYLHRWWREYYEPLSLKQQRDVINPVINRVAKFESLIARRIVGQSLSTLNFAQIVAERKIVLVKLAKGIVGSEVSALIGATVLGLLQIAIEDQGLKGTNEHIRLPIILDEFQLLSGTDYRALVELHKHGATFFLATQSLAYLQKLNSLLLPIVLANVKQMLIFQMTAQDVEIIHKEIEVERDDILYLDMQTCYASLMAANRRQPTFSARINQPLPGDITLAESIRTRSRVRYTRPIAEIDDLLRDSMIRAIRLSPVSPKPEPAEPKNHQPAKNKHKQKSSSAHPKRDRSPIQIYQENIEDNTDLEDIIAGNMENITDDNNGNMENITDDDLEDITDDNMENITDDDLEDVTDDNMENITDDDLEDITDDNMENITDEEDITFLFSQELSDELEDELD